MTTASTPIAFPSPPRTKGKFLLGDTLEIVRNPLAYILNRRPKMGDLFEADTLMHRIMFATHPDVVKHLLLDNHKQYHKSFDYAILKLVLGEGLISSDGAFWMQQRRLAQPAFHKRRLQGMFDTMLDEGQKLCARLALAQQNGGAFDMNTEMTTVTLNIVARALFGTQVDEHILTVQRNVTSLNAYISAIINNPLLPPVWVPTPGNLGFKRSKKELDDIIYGIIGQRRAEAEPKDDLLSMLMEARDEDTGEGMTDLQLRDEVLTLFLAGHETSANALCWCFMLLSKHPEIMARARQEVQAVVGDRVPEFADMQQLPYLRRVIDETLRLYPPAWIIGRKALADDVVAGFQVKKDTNIIMCLYAMHRHPDFWDDPERFDPDRFLPERSTDRHKFAYVPFGNGPRLCIGNSFAIMEMTLLLALILQKYEPKSQQETWEMEPLVTLRPKGTLMFKV